MADIEVLVSRWQAGDERAAEALYDKCWQRSFWLAYGLLGNIAAAEEVAQEALAYALMNISRYDGRRSRFSTWLHAITVSRCRDRQRRNRLLTLPLFKWLQDNSEPASPDTGPEELVVRSEEQNDVWKAIQLLKPKLREAIVLRHWGEHTYGEMAIILECPLGTAQSRVRLAYRQLEKVLRPDLAAGIVEET